MKLKKALLLVLSAVILTACSKSEPLVSGIDSSTPQPSQSSGTTTHTEQQTTAQTLAPDRSNHSEVVSSTGTGGTVNILNKEKTEPLSAKTVMHGGKVEAVIDYTIGLSGYPDSEKADVCFFAAVNGKLCEFELAGEKSSGGMLCTKKNVNTELFDVLVITDCDLVKGENELCIMYTVYYPQIVFGCPSKLGRTFSSDTKTSQSKAVELPQRYEDKLTYSHDKAELSQSTNFVFDQIRYDEQKAWSEVRAGTDVSLKLINIDLKMTGSIKRDMLVVALQNGKPIKLANGKEFAFLSLESSDCSVSIPITKLDKSGQHEFLTVCCFDMSEVIWCFRTEHMFLVR